MTGSDPTRSTWPEGEPAPPPRQEPDERGASLAEELGSSPGPASREDTRSS